MQGMIYHISLTCKAVQKTDFDVETCLNQVWFDSVLKFFGTTENLKKKNVCKLT